jgi:hypothetical protein
LKVCGFSLAWDSESFSKAHNTSFRLLAFDYAIIQEKVLSLNMKQNHADDW